MWREIDRKEVEYLMERERERREAGEEEGGGRAAAGGRDCVRRVLR